jgi:hypothetical protein
MLGENEHVYAVAWNEDDNPGFRMSDQIEPKWWRVFRFRLNRNNTPVTEPMGRDEAKAKCVEIIKLTGGKNLWS